MQDDELLVENSSGHVTVKYSHLCDVTGGLALALRLRVTMVL